MNRQGLRNRIRESAEDVQIPQQLTPEKIEEKLKRISFRTTDTTHSRKHKSDGKPVIFYRAYAVCAAVAVVVCSYALFREKDPGYVDQSSSVNQEMKVEAQQQWDVEQIEVAEEEPVKEKKADAGDLYLVAADYQEVYDVVIQSANQESMKVRNDFLVDVVMTEAEEAVATQDMPESQFSSAKLKSNFSSTNLQTQGVDESDIVKTNGSYLYIVRKNQIDIVDVRSGEPKEAGTLKVGPKNGVGNILEIYVDQEKLLVVVQESQTTLKSVGKAEYQTVTKASTTLYTYSLERPSAPKLLGSVGQDGYYHTSRKIGDTVYLFTDERISENCYGSSRDSDDWIPLAGNEKIAADCIYVPRSGGSGLVISSVDVNHPDTIYDTVMIVNQNVSVYMSTDAIYLYHTDYQSQPLRTEIAKFSLFEGRINAVGAANVNGSVSDTFAVNSYQGMLRILTDDNTGEGSSLYILDENLSLMGSIEKIAPGEQIYAARYLEDMAYFVTYRNMDPLFAADLTDPYHPAILGELKITGYSDYLHMWKEDTMYGIGYETDPETGRQKGVKLAMFDVADPMNLSVLDSVCITNADYSPAMSQYKTILTDYDNNLIGFVVTDYDKYEASTYLLFKWEDGKFENILSSTIEGKASYVRGVYAGDYFYIVTMDTVTGYHRTKGFVELGKLSL